MNHLLIKFCCRPYSPFLFSNYPIIRVVVVETFHINSSCKMQVLNDDFIYQVWKWAKPKSHCLLKQLASCLIFHFCLLCCSPLPPPPPTYWGSTRGFCSHGIKGKQRMALALVAISKIKDFFYVEKSILYTKLSKCVYQQHYPSTSQMRLLDSMISAQVSSRPLKWQVLWRGSSHKCLMVWLSVQLECWVTPQELLYVSWICVFLP